MSKIGLAARLAAILNAAERIDPMAVAVHSLPSHMRRRYRSWRAENAQAIATLEEREGQGAAFAAIADGRPVTLPIPSSLAEALHIRDLPTVPHDATEAHVAALYNEMIGD